MNPTVPMVFGAGMPKDNIGEMKNRGWELSLNYNLKPVNFYTNLYSILLTHNTK